MTDDFIEDTPTSGPSFFCYDLVEENSCIDSIGDKPDNQANIMAYACMRMTTPGQSEIMRNNLNQSKGLWMTEDECNAYVATKQEILEHEIEIYPNPNDGNFLIQFPQKTFEKGKVSLFDIHGKLVFSQEEQWSSNVSISVDSKNLKGLYFLKIESENKRWVKKVCIE